MTVEELDQYAYIHLSKHFSSTEGMMKYYVSIRYENGSIYVYGHCDNATTLPEAIENAKKDLLENVRQEVEHCNQRIAERSQLKDLERMFLQGEK